MSGHRARKRFGQHFLAPVWARKVVEAIAPTLPSLLRQIDGTKTVPKGYVLHTANAEIVDVGNDALAIAGITDGVSPALMWRAAVEDLTAMTGEALDHMARVAGPHTSAVVAGGWSRNAMVAQAKMHQLGSPTFVDIDEPGALGAAYLGGVAAGLLERPGADGQPHWQVSG